MSDLGYRINTLKKRLGSWLKPNIPEEPPYSVATAESLLDRQGLSQYLPFRDFDDDNNLLFVDEGSHVSCGFTLIYTPLLIAGLESEGQLEAIVNACPPDTIITSGVLSSSYIDLIVENWSNARRSATNNTLIEQMALRRMDYMKETALGPSMLSGQEIHPRNIQYFISIKVPYKGDVDNELQISSWVKETSELAKTIQGTLEGASMASSMLDSYYTRRLFRELLNPQIPPADRVARADESNYFQEGLIDKDTCIRVRDDGTIGFTDRPNADPKEDKVRMASLTVDHFPSSLYLPNIGKFLGSPESRDERITPPFWIYTVIHVLDPDKAKDSITATFGLINKQLMSESQWYLSMMSHLVHRKNDMDNLLQILRSGRQPVRVFTGINIYSTPLRVRRDIEYISSLWRKAGIRATPEKFISLPVFMASLPLGYSYTLDKPNKGLQRARTLHSMNAACLFHVQGDWSGNPPGEGGILMTSRRGQLACFNLLNTISNYNYVIVASSGQGKSFFANEIVCDFLSRNGIIRLFDVGRSYAPLCDIFGGQMLVFDPKKPISMNPFWDINDIHELSEMMPLLKSVLRQMAYPNQSENETPPWQFATIEKAILESWRVYRGKLDIKNIYDWLISHDDVRAQDLAHQLEPFALGRYVDWFKGERKLKFEGKLVVVEFEELEPDPELAAVVLTLSIYMTTKEMYLSSRELPKLLQIDEAWSLLGNVKAAKFIETAFRRARKYNGIAGVVTQSFEDFEKSDASRAALQNASWQFILRQRPESLEAAIKNKAIVTNDSLVNLLRTVQSGSGYSEVFVRSEYGEGVYRFIVDKHTYYTYTTRPADINRRDALVREGKSMLEAIHLLAMEDYQREQEALSSV